MNDIEFNDMLEARLRLAYHEVAVAPPRPRDAHRGGAGLRRSVRIPALLATPVLALFSVLVVAGASDVAKTVVTGSPNPLDWAPRHAVVVPAVRPPAAAPAVEPGAAAAAPGHPHPTANPGRGGGAAGGSSHAGGTAGGKDVGGGATGSQGTGGPGVGAPAHGNGGSSQP